MVNIIPTVGPSCCEIKCLEYLVKKSKIIRFNGSHNTLIWHKKYMNLIKKIDKKTVILFDIPGIKMRTLNESSIKIEKGLRYNFHNLKKRNVKGIPVSNYFLKKHKKFPSFSLSDGKYIFKNIQVSDGYFSGISQENFDLEPKKGVNIPNYVYDDRIQTKLYEDFIDKIKNFPFDAIGLSYIQNKNTLLSLRSKLKNKVVISKIENKLGLKNIDEISFNSNGIMIDRGDLVAEIGQENLFKSINKITESVKKNGKFLIMATENLESLLNSNQPSKSEIVSLSHSLSIGIDSIMLSNETAVNKNWKQSFNWLKNFIINSEGRVTNNKYISFFESIWDLKNVPTIIFSKNGYGVREFRKRFKMNIYCITDQLNTYNELIFFSNVKVTIEKTSFSRVDYNYIKKSTINIFKKYNLKFNFIRVIWIAFPKSKSRLNSISLFKKDELFKK